MKKIISLMVLAGLACPLFARAATYTASPEVDGFVNSRGGSMNAGGNLNIWGCSWWAWERAFVKFDLSSLPAMQSVDSATLRLVMIKADNPENIPVEVHYVGEPWTTDATWGTSDGSTPWPKYDGFSNIDYCVEGYWDAVHAGGNLHGVSTLAVDTFTPATTAEAGQVVEFEGKWAAEKWLLDGENNNGFYLRMGKTIWGTPSSEMYTVQFYSMENAEFAPQLIINDVAVPIVSELPGDANCDGVVDVGDLGILAGNYGMESGATWATGDFNNDGAVDVGDLGILAGNYGASAAASVPEPMTLGLLAMGGLTLLRRSKLED